MAESTVPAATMPNDVAASTRENSRYLVPPVDIFETAEGLEVIADLPGVVKDDVDVRVENGLLTINARIRNGHNGDPVHFEYNLMNYHRQFQLGETVDQEKISADLKNGVLTLHLPKVEKAKPRQIRVNVA